MADIVLVLRLMLTISAAVCRPLSSVQRALMITETGRKIVRNDADKSNVSREMKRQ